VACTDRITVIGSGYVGLTTGVCLASLGHPVTCVDRDPATVAALRQGRTVLAEPAMRTLLRDGLGYGMLEFDTTADAAVAASPIVFLCLPTPPRSDGAADLTAITDTMTAIRDRLRPDTVLVTKSTVPVGTTDTIRALLGRNDIAVVSNPEVLREGHAVYDFLHPTRILIGADDPAAAKRIARLYEAVRTEVIITSPATAELAKYAANCFLATKLSYVNTLAELCEALSADITDLTHVLGGFVGENRPQMSTSFDRADRQMLVIDVGEN
jgi:UDPglucose 6-dehydrogenase